MFLRFLYSKIVLILFLLSSLGALFGIILFYQHRIDTLSKIDFRSQQSIKLSYEVEIALRAEIQEWKNILLRGHDARDREQYYRAFLKNSQNFKEKMKQVIYLLETLHSKDAPLFAQLKEIQKAHDTLSATYMQAYAFFADGSYEKKLLLDKIVRGADRNLPLKLEVLRENLKKTHEALREKNIAQFKNFNLALVIMLFFIVIVALYIFYITSKIGQSKKMLDNILENISQGVMLLEKEKVVYVSKKYSDIMKQDLVGQSVKELLSHIFPQDARKIRKEQLKALNEKKSSLNYRYRLILPDGSLKWIEDNVAIKYDKYGQFDCSYVISRDITDEIENQKKLLESEERYRTFVKLSNDMLFLKDDAYRYLIVNENLASFLNKEESQIIGKTDYDLLSYENAKICRSSDVHTLSGEVKTISQEYIEGKIYETTKYPMQFLGKTYLAGIIKDITEKTQTKDEMLRLAFYNPLTHLPNKRLFLDRLKHAITLASQSKTKGAVVLMDVDHFKIINDTWGHEKGDLLLKSIADRLENLVYPQETIAHIGGDEFILMIENLELSNEENVDFVESRANEIKMKLQEPYFFEDKEYLCTISMGASFFCVKECSESTLMKNIEIALYKAKDDGRNRLSFFEQDMQLSLNQRFELENDLRKGLEREEFELYLQIQMNAQQNIIGAEALLRWNHENNLISPMAFIPVLESSGLIVEVGFWVLQEGCKILQAWSEEECLSSFTLSLNISVIQFEKEDFVLHVKKLLDQYSFEPQKLKLELTENLFFKNPQESIQKLLELKALGIGIALDDFGTGYASLSYLKRIPISQLKIDQSFVRDIFDDKSDATIVELIISVGKKLGLEVLAEGVENFEQFTWLKDHGCEFFQGYHFAKPQTRALFEAKVRKFSN